MPPPKHRRKDLTVPQYEPHGGGCSANGGSSLSHRRRWKSKQMHSFENGIRFIDEQERATFVYLNISEAVLFGRSIDTTHIAEVTIPNIDDDECGEDVLHFGIKWIS